MLIKRSSNQAFLNRTLTKGIMYDNGNPYNKRFQFYIRNSFKTEPLEHEHTRVRKPEDSPEYDSWYGPTIREWTNRLRPNLNLFKGRIHRTVDPVNMYFLPIWACIGFVNWDLTFGYKLFTIIPLSCLYTRCRNKVVDPEIPEAHLREMIYAHERLGSLFKVETTNVIDYGAEYDRGFPDSKEFPEFDNFIFSNLIRAIQH